MTLEFSKNLRGSEETEKPIAFRKPDLYIAVLPLQRSGSDNSRNNGEVSPMTFESLKAVELFHENHSDDAIVIVTIQCRIIAIVILIILEQRPSLPPHPTPFEAPVSPASRRRFYPNKIDSSVPYHSTMQSSPLLSREPGKKFSTHLNPHIYRGDGWRSRGYLPHFDRPGLIQTITFRLADSLPKDALEQWAREIESLPESKQKDEILKRIQYFVDQGYGKCYLRDPRIAELVENALLHFDGQRYNLIAWCIMPNHVHVIIETFDGFGLDSVLHSWKSFTAKEANKILHRTGTFWQREYYDRFIRDDVHFYRAKHYIEENPVKAGLAESAGDWRWSSAWGGRFVTKANTGAEK